MDMAVLPVLASFQPRRVVVIAWCHAVYESGIREHHYRDQLEDFFLTRPIDSLSHLIILVSALRNTWFTTHTQRGQWTQD